MTSSSSRHQPSRLAAIVALFAFSGLALTAALTQSYVKHTPVSTKAPLSSTDFVPHDQAYVFFFSKVLANRSLAQVSLPFKTGDTSQILFLGFTPESEQVRTDLLISHPQLDNLSWDHLGKENLYLYQRTPTYSSVEDFLASPPSVDQIATDARLTDTYTQFSSAQLTNQILDLSSINYILTTHKPPVRQNDYFFYQTTLDISQAQLNDAEQIEWYIKNDLAESGEPFYLGAINIEYL